MIKSNNKGFTLLEMLISIFILTTVIFIGYKVIDKSTIYIQNRKNIHEGQLAVNDINEYLMDDLKCATSVVISSNYLTETNTFTDDSTQENEITNDRLKGEFEKYLANTPDEPFDYSYQIDYKKDENNIKKIIYNVEIIKDKNDYKYSISREVTNEVLITFITNKILTEEVLSREDKLPLKIELDSPYEVTLGYTGKNNDEFVEHQFAIASRLHDIPLVEETPPTVDQIKPPEEWEDDPNVVIDYNAIGFWILDSNEREDNNLYTWISTDGKILGEAYADQDKDKIDEFNIEGNARPGNNADTSSYIGYNTMSTDLNWKGQVKGVSIGEKDITEISIYISKGTTLKDFKIEGQQGGAKIQLKEPLHEGWNHCTITKNGNSKVNFNFTGKLSIDKSKVSSGYAYVIYKREGGSSSSEELKGDLIFELTKLNETQNNGEYCWKKEVKYNMLGNITSADNETLKHNGYNENFNILLKNDSQKSIEAHIGGNPTKTIWDDRIQNIVGMKIKLYGDIKITGFKFPNYETVDLIDTQKVYEFKGLSKNQHNISGNIEISSNGSVGDKSRLIIDFIYE